uniref:Reverse transcriptase domain-containing protein n=1 Tax=Trichuris muris TaxID=70415 RepID=A0A5S6Q269_TRIMR
MNNFDQVVVNLSSITLSSVEQCFLSKGLNFVPTPKDPPILDMICSVEHSLSKVDPTKTAEIKGAVSSCLARRHKATPKLNNLERKVLKGLRCNKELLITKADKGNVVVLLNLHDYLVKINALLNADIYRPLQSDPTTRTRKEALLLLRRFADESKDKVVSKIGQKLYFTSNSKCPELYGLPKIHKPEVPFRPVICTARRMTSDLSSYLKSIIQPLTGGRDSHVTNYKDFCSALKAFNIAPNHVIVSYDVKDLFTSIPMSHILNTLQLLMDSDSTLHERTHLNPSHLVLLFSVCMNEGNYFKFQEKFHAQTNGAPMGSSLSPVLAELFM